MVFVFVVTLAALVAFIKAWWSADATALIMLLVLVVGGALPARDAFQAFGNEALVTVAAMFVLSAALTRTGAVEVVGRAILRAGGTSEPRILVALMLACMAASAVLNNTPVAVVFLPIVLGIAERTGIAGSRFLLPMSYATIVGGMMTVVGTSTNVLVSLELPRFGLDPLPLLAPLPLALAGALLTVAYLVLVGRHLLPRNATVSSAAARGGAEYVTELRVEAGGPLVGLAPQDALGPRAPRARVLQVIRGEAILQPGAPGLRLEPGDTLLAKGDPDTLLALTRVSGVAVGTAGRTSNARRRAVTLAELLVRPTSGVIGARVGDLKLHAMHGVAVLAVQRDGAHTREKVVDITLRLGDLLLVEGEAESFRHFRGSQDFVLLEGVGETVVVRERAWVAVAAIAVVVPLASLGVLPISVLAVAAGLVVVAGGCVSAREAYRAIDLPLLMLMAGCLGLGQALRDSGGAAWLAEGILAVARPWGAVAVLGAVYLATNVLTAFVSNAAAALMMLPFALEVAAQGPWQPQPFVMAVMFAASIDFSTPFGYQTNTFVYGPGGYRFMDYVRLGAPLNLLWWLLATALIPVFWPL